jgi:Fe-S oxidoreductase
VKKEFHDIARKIARPVVNKVLQSEADHFASDCPMAAEQIAQGLDGQAGEHPMGLLRRAYGI